LSGCALGNRASSNVKSSFVTYFDGATKDSKDKEELQHRISKIDSRPGTAGTDTSLVERRTHEEERRKTKKLAAVGKQAFSLNGFDHQPDNQQIKKSLIQNQDGYFGPSDYKNKLICTDYGMNGSPHPNNIRYSLPIREFDQPEARGQNDFKAYFGKTWECESWRKDVMVNEKISLIDEGGGHDAVVEGSVSGRGTGHLSQTIW